MNYRSVYRVLSTKDAISVLFDIYEGCKIEQYLTFSELRKKYKKSEASLRRLTNRLSRSGLIKSVKSNQVTDKRARVFIVTDAKMCDEIKILTLMMV